MALSGCGVLPGYPAALPDTFVPQATPSPIDQARLDSPNGFTQAERLSIRVFNEFCDGYATGSGWIYDEHTVVTNRHVVEGQLHLILTGYDGTIYTATDVQVSNVADLAIITVAETFPDHLALAPVRATKGSAVVVVGFPGGNEQTISEGFITVLLADDLDTEDYNVWETTADGFHGSSGSPVLNLDGDVVAVLYAGTDDGDYSFVIPVSYLRTTLNEDGHLLPELGACDY